VVLLCSAERKKILKKYITDSKINKTFSLNQKIEV